MTDFVDQFLEHHGVKGMKWGKRKSRRAEKKEAKADKKWERKTVSSKTLYAVYNEAARAANKDLDGINAKHEGKNFNIDSADRRKYYDEVAANFNSHVQTAAAKYNQSPSGKKRLQVDINPISGEFTIQSVDVSHADGKPKLVVKRNKNGLIISIDIVDDSMTQGDMFVEEYIEHYGVKGMKWGKRKKRTRSEESSENKTVRKKRAKELSNAELQKSIKRMELETKYKKMNPSGLSKGQKQVTALLAVGTTVNAAIAFANSPAGAAIKKNLAR